MTIISRIKKIEADLAAAPNGAVLFREPAANEDDATREAFDAEVRKTLESGVKAIVVRNGEDRLRHPGVTYVPNDFEGQLALAAATPDPIHGDRLKAILAKAMGTTLPVVRKVADDE